MQAADSDMVTYMLSGDDYSINEIQTELFLWGNNRIKDRLQRWTDAASHGHVSNMLIGCQQPDALALVAESVL